MKNIIRQQAKIVTHYQKAAVVPHLIGGRLFEKLELIKLAPTRVLDLGTGTGQFLKPLKTRFPQATVYGVDIALPMLVFNKKHQQWRHKFSLAAANSAHLPFLDNTFEFIFMNMVLPFGCDLVTTFKEISRVLKPDGLFLFSSCGSDTLKELKTAWQQVDTDEHINQFPDMHDVADMLLHEGFADPVVDMEVLTVNYQSVRQLIHELKNIGSVKLSSTMFKGLYTKDLIRKISENYTTADGYYPVSVEVIYGHAWGKQLGTSIKNMDGSVSIPISRIKKQ